MANIKHKKVESSRETLMYVGPTCRTLPLIHNTVYTQIPNEAQEAMEKNPQLRLLFIPISRVPDIEVQMRKQIGAYYAAYCAVAGL